MTISHLKTRYCCTPKSLFHQKYLRQWIIPKNLSPPMAKQPLVVQVLIIEASRSHSDRHTTLSRSRLDEWSARRRDHYLTAHNTHKRQIDMPSAGFERAIPASERPQTHATANGPKQYTCYSESLPTKQWGCSRVLLASWSQFVGLWLPRDRNCSAVVQFVFGNPKKWIECVQSERWRGGAKLDMNQRAISKMSLCNGMKPQERPVKREKLYSAENKRKKKHGPLYPYRLK